VDPVSGRLQRGGRTYLDAVNANLEELLAVEVD